MRRRAKMAPTWSGRGGSKDDELCFLCPDQGFRMRGSIISWAMNIRVRQSRPRFLLKGLRDIAYDRASSTCPTSARERCSDVVSVEVKPGKPVAGGGCCVTYTTMTLYVIGLGLCNEKDITVRGLEASTRWRTASHPHHDRRPQAVRSSTRVYLEAYTSILMVQKERLASQFNEAFYGKPILLADRDTVETDSDTILHDADTQDIAFLVVGDPFGATTHTDIVLRARAKHIPVRIIHNASIVNAVGTTGLQLYNFGQAVSLVFFTDTWKPDSFYDRIKENSDLGLHTLVLLDIKVKEQNEENLARGRKIYEPPRYMSIPQAVSQLLEIESLRDQKVLASKTTLAIALSRVGGDANDQRIVCGTLEELSQQSPEVFGEPLHSLVIVGKRLHHLEVDYAQEYAVNKETWRRVASQVYGCALE
ncbi:tetrapyrrole methylase [Boletus reticuloceps]|uniref:diphthine methyl ester synthase n=1 Tax=Boletus reticuloceps TaxID=495285 RepID=A0A8I2Z1F3_9AGAM|nr:tetrapyrrole methylase [Boletus reticuloceps]